MSILKDCFPTVAIAATAYCFLYYYPFSDLNSTSEILTFWPVINRCETNNLWKFIDEYCKLVYYNRSNLKQVAKVIWVMSNGCPKLLVRIVPTREYWVNTRIFYKISSFFKSFKNPYCIYYLCLIFDYNRNQYYDYYY